MSAEDNQNPKVYSGSINKVRDHKWKWVWKPRPDGKGVDRLYNVGILVDGSLYNPNGYDEQVVRQAVTSALERRRQRFSDASKKAADTRARRRELKIESAVLAVEVGKVLGPRPRCYCCGKRLEDQQSIDRGIGSDCWQEILSRLERKRAADSPHGG